MNWLREHWLALAAAFARIRKTPGSFGFNVLVISLALILPLAGLTLLENLRPVSRDLAVDPEISIFMASGAGRERVQAIGGEIRDAARRAGVPVKLEFVDREKALATMKSRAGLGEVVEALGSNPLPDAYVVRIGGGEQAASPARIEQLAGALEKLDGVETVQLDAAWVKRLAAFGVVLAVVFGGLFFAFIGAPTPGNIPNFGALGLMMIVMIVLGTLIGIYIVALVTAIHNQLAPTGTDRISEAFA